MAVAGAWCRCTVVAMVGSMAVEEVLQLLALEEVLPLLVSCSCMLTAEVVLPWLVVE